MAYSFEELLSQSDRFRQVTKAIDLNVKRLSSDGTTFADGEPDPWLYKKLPVKGYATLEQVIMRFNRARPVMGAIVALDQEIPQERQRMELSEQNLGNAKIGLARQFNEEDLTLLHKIKMLQSTPGMAEAANEMIQSIAAIPVQLSSGVMYKLFYLCCRVLVLGQCAYRDPKTNRLVDLSYLEHVPAGHFPTPLTGAARWSQAATANGVQNLIDHFTTYYATLRRYPSTVVMPVNTFTQLRNQASTKEMMLRDLGVLSTLDATNQTALGMVAGATAEQVAMAVGKRLTDQTGRPGTVSIQVTDGLAYERNKQGALNSFPWIPDDYYFFLEEGIIEQGILPNPSNDFKQGMKISFEKLREDPHLEATTVSAVGVPLCFDPRFLGARNVNDTAVSINV